MNFEVSTFFPLFLTILLIMVKFVIFFSQFLAILLTMVEFVIQAVQFWTINRDLL